MTFETRNVEAVEATLPVKKPSIYQDIIDFFWGMPDEEAMFVPWSRGRHLENPTNFLNSLKSAITNNSSSYETAEKLGVQFGVYDYEVKFQADFEKPGFWIWRKEKADHRFRREREDAMRAEGATDQEIERFRRWGSVTIAQELVKAMR